METYDDLSAGMKAQLPSARARGKYTRCHELLDDPRIGAVIQRWQGEGILRDIPTEALIVFIAGSHRTDCLHTAPFLEGTEWQIPMGAFKNVPQWWDQGPSGRGTDLWTKMAKRPDFPFKDDLEKVLRPGWWFPGMAGSVAGQERGLQDQVVAWIGMKMLQTEYQHSAAVLNVQTSPWLQVEDPAWLPGTFVMFNAFSAGPGKLPELFGKLGGSWGGDSTENIRRIVVRTAGRVARGFQEGSPNRHSNAVHGILRTLQKIHATAGFMRVMGNRMEKVYWPLTQLDPAVERVILAGNYHVTPLVDDAEHVLGMD